MEKRVYVIRHCEADGQLSEARLTEKGIQQAADLAEFFSEKKIDRIITSPFLRAIQSIEPVAEVGKVELEVDNRLSERILSTKNLTDWLEKLEATFEDSDLKFEGGESSREATNRVVSVIENIFKSNSENTLVVTHGNLLSLLLKNYLPEFGFEQWKKLSNPDVFLLTVHDNEFLIERLWQE